MISPLESLSGVLRKVCIRLRNQAPASKTVQVLAAVSSGRPLTLNLTMNQTARKDSQVWVLGPA